MKKVYISGLFLVAFTIYATYVRIVGLPSRDLTGYQDQPLGLSSDTNSLTIPDLNAAPAPTPTQTPPESTPLPTAPAPIVSPQATPTPVVPKPTLTGMYRDGAYVGSNADAYYGYIQVKAIIRGGKIADVQFLDYPQDRENSIFINSQAMPMLTSEAIQAQSANVDIVSGATDTSYAFRESLAYALTQAKN